MPSIAVCVQPARHPRPAAPPSRIPDAAGHAGQWFDARDPNAPAVTPAYCHRLHPGAPVCCNRMRAMVVSARREEKGAWVPASSHASMRYMQGDEVL